ncbi:indolepyruvate ferredoxin oxidoreductase [Verrucomicrobia bacterium LW23]|nr:indolepyruvate ferredoxin oxidoreductase [Verrucomicrobia bacterium LW23]
MKVDPRFLKEEGHEVFLGNELIVKGLLEADGGTHLWTGYPGSPISGFFDCIESIQEIPRKYGIHAAIANNEALSAAMVNGSQMSGLRAVTAMKSVGLHVAADALALGNLAGAHPDGGVLVICGDDPWSDSTQVPADSRFLCKHLYMPVLEPATNQELKDWVDIGLKLSREAELYIGFLVTTPQADGGGSVIVRRNHFPRVNTHNKITLDTDRVDFENRVLLPPRTWRREQDLPSRYERLWKSAAAYGVNHLSLPHESGGMAGALPASPSAPIACVQPSGITPPKAGNFMPVSTSDPTSEAFDENFVVTRTSATSSALSQPPPIPVRKRYPVGFVTSAVAATYLQHALREMDMLDVLPVLKLGVTYPLDPQCIMQLAEHVDAIVVVEERRGFLEEQIALILSERRMHIPLYGKGFPFDLPGFPSARGLNPSLVIQYIAPLLRRLQEECPSRMPTSLARVDAEEALLAETSRFEVNLVPRTPTFCPGCPHRDSAAVLLELKKNFRDEAFMRARHRREPVDVVFHGDTGCYTMLMFEPNKPLMHNYSGMGLGGATGMGIDPFITNKQVVFMGDSTFFHSGQVAISNSAKNNQDITYIILDNKTTAMTGHQPTPGIEQDIMGNSTFVQNIDKVVESILEQHPIEVVRTNPEQREQYRELLEETILKNGVKVIVADKECGITFHRRRNRADRAEVRKNGFVRTKTYINITPDVCETCLECTRATGCPGLTFTDTDFGRKLQTDLSWCVSDTACTKIHACPSFEQVTVIRSKKPFSRLAEIQSAVLPEPSTHVFDSEWHAYLAGVGGMGIATSTATLVRAGHREGYEVNFCDKNGLAIRNGGVYSQITFRRAGTTPTSPLIPYGKSDLILGLDPLEAARGLDPAQNQRVGSPRRTTAILNRAKTPTIHGLLGKDDFCIDDIEKTVKRYTKADAFFSADVSELSERIFGTKIYTNVIMLGVAYQRGVLPLSLDSLEYGIQETMGSAATENWQAFRLGRKMVLDAEKLEDERRAAVAARDDYHRVVAEKSELLKKEVRQGQAVARAYWQLVASTIGEMQLDARHQSLLAGRIYDLIRYEDITVAREYTERLLRVHRKDWASTDYAATRAALWNLHRVTAIKDEPYVAYLLTSEEKYARDRERYKINPELGDRVVYHHLNRPEFTLGKTKLRFAIRTRPWMLRLMRHAKFLRRILPGWHAEERAFRDWYYMVAEGFAPTDAASYATWLTLLRLPEEARGYREVRYPQMRAAMERGNAMLRKLAAEVVGDEEVARG